MPYTRVTWVDDVTPLDAAHLNPMDIGIATLDTGKVDVDAVVTAAVRLVASKLLVGDAQPAFRILGDGTHQWGAGAASVPDTVLFRSAANNLKTGQHFHAGLDIYAQDGNAAQVRIGNSNGNATLAFGSALDTNLYRYVAGSLKTDGFFYHAGTSVFNPATAAGVAFASLVGAEANYRWSVNVNGTMQWGAGGATATDTILSRIAAGQLALGTTTQRGYLRLYSDVPSSQALIFVNAAEAGYRFQITGSGTISWGDGTNPVDTNLYRNGANALKTDGAFTHVGTSYYNPATPTGTAFASQVSGESTARWSARYDGLLQWGPGGSTVADTNFYRSAAGVLKTDGVLNAVGGLQINGVSVAAAKTWMTGDTKVSAQTATHADPAGGTWYLADGSALPGAETALIALIGANLPDAKGRGLVVRGTHVDVDTIGDNDGSALANRRPRHKHTKNGAASLSGTVGFSDGGHFHTAPGPSNTFVLWSSAGNVNNGTDPPNNAGQRWSIGQYTNTVAATANITVNNGSLAVSDTISVGPQTGAEPLDSPAYIVVGNLFYHS